MRRLHGACLLPGGDSNGKIVAVRQSAAMAANSEGKVHVETRICVNTRGENGDEDGAGFESRMSFCVSW